MSQCRKSYLRRVWKKRKVLNNLLNTGLSDPGVPWPGNPRFLQISSPYLNQVGSLCPPHYSFALQIFRPSYGPEIRDKFRTKNTCYRHSFATSFATATDTCSAFKQGLKNGKAKFFQVVFFMLWFCCQSNLLSIYWVAMRKRQMLARKPNYYFFFLLFSSFILLKPKAIIAGTSKTQRTKKILFIFSLIILMQTSVCIL